MWGVRPLWAGEATLAPESTTIGVDYIASAYMESSYPGTDQNMLHILSNDTATPDKAISLVRQPILRRLILLSLPCRGIAGL